jgi:hypothetical protein
MAISIDEDKARATQIEDNSMTFYKIEKRRIIEEKDIPNRTREFGRYLHSAWRF